MKTVEYDIIDLPEIAIIGKEGLCTKEKNLAQDLWRQANSDFREIADLGMKKRRWFFCWILGSHERRDNVFYAVDGGFLERNVFGRS